MKERPIIFSGPMVRAILEGRKTQTRRLAGDIPSLMAKHNISLSLLKPNYADNLPHRECWFFSRYGLPGDRLWVRENFCDHDFKLGGERLYRANGEFLEGWANRGLRWKPSIHMPRDWSRITLEITGIRPERLQNITEGDARQEGCEACMYTESAIAALDPESEDGKLARALGPGNFTAKFDFYMLWDRIHGKKHPWSENPWVWVISFRRINP